MKSVLQYTGIVVLVLTLAIASAARAENPSTAKTRPPARLAVIPQPVHCRTLSGNFVLSGKTEIVYASGLGALARLAAGQLGIRAAMQEGGSRDNAVHLFLDSSVAAEDYKLDITPGRITIVGGSSTGVFYGVQTLRQILGPSPITDFAKVPCLSIQDQPRFAWRGLMLDCSRTFQSLDYLRKTIDRMAFYKMNVLHLHLTDDQGWRMEIRKYPELTRKGAHFSPKHKEPLSHEGCYTQAELKELVAYAALRGIAIVPEIEMPGHSLALLVCRPELSCAGKTADDIFPLSKGPLITVNVLCAGNEQTFEFLEDVLDEVLQVFPSKYIHIGGDEVLKWYWNACPKCQARIKAEGLKDEHELQSYFVRRMERYLAGKGRSLIGWDEILEGGLAPQRRRHELAQHQGGHRRGEGGAPGRDDAQTVLLLRLYLQVD